MNSFVGISKLHTTNLAVVAPGIAEALLATAFGLAAAIPAVAIYIQCLRSLDRQLSCALCGRKCRAAQPAEP
jgi:biopolymer transport protein ExbB/TolQ